MHTPSSHHTSLYLWDLGDTLIYEHWNPTITGFPDFVSYVRSLGADPHDPVAFEQSYHTPYTHGEMMDLALMPGYRDVLSWTQNNESFSSGFPAQVDWRAEYLNPRVGFDIRDLIERRNSTFDFGQTNVKTQDMFRELLRRRAAQGYARVVYTDDKRANLDLFRLAAEEVKAESPTFTWRAYHMMNDRGGVRRRDWYTEIGSLFDLREAEQSPT